MSGIYIPNIKMPEACIIGKLPYYEYCPCFGGCSKASSKTERPSDCPLVEVPSDVRLIDAYSLAVKVAEAQDKLKGEEYDPFMLLGDVLRWIELEPTVVEASKE